MFQETRWFGLAWYIAGVMNCLLRLMTFVAIIHLSHSVPKLTSLRTTVINRKRVEGVLQEAKEIHRRQRTPDNESRSRSDNVSSRSYDLGASGDTEAYAKANDALLALRILMKEDGYSPEDLQTESAMATLQRVKGFECKLSDPGTCDFTSVYRTLDGSCNNKGNPGWGMAGMIQQRMVNSQYERIKAIQQYSLAKILCHNDNVTEMNYPSAFKNSDPLISCDDIPDLDLTAFITGN